MEVISNFLFLENEYPELAKLGQLAERNCYTDPSTTLSKLRILSEKLARYIIDIDGLEDTPDNKQITRLRILQEEVQLPVEIIDIFHTIRKSGNKASHDGTGTEAEARFMLRKAFHLLEWFYEVYENVEVIAEYRVPQPEWFDKNSQRTKLLEEQLEALKDKIASYETKVASLQVESPEGKADRNKRAEYKASKIQFTEAETREEIDQQLRKAGWLCDTNTLNYKKNRTVPEKGKNIAIAEWPCGTKWADYALFIGTTLYGIVEAKKYATDISTDLRQSKVYSTLISQSEDYKILGEWNEYKVPFLFSTNGRPYLEQLKTKSGIWFLDIRNERNHSKALKGWYPPQSLLSLYQRDIEVANNRLSDDDYEYLQNPKNLGLRYYQIDAIKAIEDKIINNPNEKRALLVMATGTGKTRTVIGLAYRLIKSDRFKRILFLTDRRLLATQALDSFSDNKIEGINTFSDIYELRGLETSLPDSDTRLHFATVQSLVKRLFYAENEELHIDTYDCIIIDEAHRGYNLDKEIDEDDLHFKDENDYISQYKRVIDYFDAYIIGLTATPALHTKEVFGEPVHSYSYREAVIDGYLVDHEPPYLLKTKLSEEGILWEKGDRPKVYDPETNSIKELAALEDEIKVEIEQFNKLVITEPFNKEVIKQLVQEIDPEGDEKTMIFAARDSHADLIVKLLYEEFSNIGLDVPQNAIEKITGNVYKPEELTRRLKNEKFPSIVVTVDLLTTGIDVPAITNLVFLRRVRSRILFEQMMGRATRLCPDIDKQFFRVYDAVRVYEALKDYTQIKTVSNPSISFVKLVEELGHINSADRSKKQMDQIIAKLQRKKKEINEHNLDEFTYLAQGNTPEELIDILKDIDGESVHQVVTEYASLWQFLDKKIYRPRVQLVSEHHDEYRPMERGYGNAQKPEDYIEGFKKFITENRNTIAAIQVICTKPAELDRQSLKELKLLLDQEGYNSLSLNIAWKNATNQDIAADIISYIRTLALDTDLVSHEQRIKNAVAHIKGLKPWNKIQQKWIDRFEAQLLKETILTKEDLDREPFKNDGGFNRLNKIFENNLEEVLQVLNDNLYSA